MSVVDAELMKNNIALIFKATRKFHGLQQTEFSAILGITQGTISKIEAGTMATELCLWFRFIESFKIEDPFACFYGTIILPVKSFSTLQNGESSLAPKYNITDKEIFQVKHIKPLVEYLNKVHQKAMDSFLMEHKIKKEIFSILNHPLSFEFVDDFFTFALSRKIPLDLPGMLSFDFKETFLNKEESASKNIELVGEPWSDLTEPFVVRVDPGKGAYRFVLKKKVHSEIAKLNNAVPILKYLASSPYWALKYFGKTNSSATIVKFDQFNKEASVSF